MSKILNIGIAGLGTVGGGVVKILQNQAEILQKRCGARIVIKAVSARNKQKDRGFSLDSDVSWYDDPVDLASDESLDMIVELIGGSDGAALKLCEASLANGKDFVTANKALIAKHGLQLAKLAAENNVSLLFEAAVAGGIPIIKSLKEGLIANKFSYIAGIMNGTGNYILTAMKETGRDFADILKEAQDLGYAEAEPSFDIDGIDTAHKLSILASLAFGTKLDFANVHIEGIRDISLLDIEYAYELGYKIKLLGIAKMTKDGLEQRVYPSLLALSHPLAKIDGVDNAVLIQGDPVGRILLQGPGAGEGATASAVVADIADIASGNLSNPFAITVDNLITPNNIGMQDHHGEYYIRITARDETGILADISDILRNEKISVESIVQKPVKQGDNANIVVITHACAEKTIFAAMDNIANIKNVVGKPKIFRIEA